MKKEYDKHLSEERERALVSKEIEQKATAQREEQRYQKLYHMFHTQNADYVRIINNVMAEIICDIIYRMLTFQSTNSQIMLTNTTKLLKNIVRRVRSGRTTHSQQMNRVSVEIYWELLMVGNAFLKAAQSFQRNTPHWTLLKDRSKTLISLAHYHACLLSYSNKHFWLEKKITEELLWNKFLTAAQSS